VKPRTSIFEPANCEGFEMRIARLGEQFINLTRAKAASIRRQLEQAHIFPFTEGPIGPCAGESRSSGSFGAISGFESEDIEVQLLCSRVAGSA